MPDATALFDAVRHLNPIILTGLPRGNWAAQQKVRWAAEHFPGTRIITCLAADKRRHAREGDILVDDTLRYEPLWTGAGGRFVHHCGAEATIDELHRLIPEAMAATWACQCKALRNFLGVFRAGGQPLLENIDAARSA